MSPISHGAALLNIDGQHIIEPEDWLKRAIEINQKMA